MTIRTSAVTVLTSLALFVGGNAYAQYDPVGDKPSLNLSLIAKAIRSMDGFAEGVVRGPDAERLKQMTRSSSPIFATVRVVQRFTQFECARVEIDVSQADVPTTDGGVIKFEMPTVGMNICTDGNPPDGNIEDLPKGNWHPTPEMFEQ